MIPEATIRTRSVACATCGAPVDRVRAPAVRFSSAVQLHFCSREHALAYGSWGAPSPAPATTFADEVAGEFVETPAPPREEELSPREPRVEPSRAEPQRGDVLRALDPPASHRAQLAPEELTPLPESASTSAAPPAPRRRFDGGAALRLAPAGLAAISFLLALWNGESATSELSLVALLLGATLSGERLAHRLLERDRKTRAELARFLDVPARRVREGHQELTHAEELRAGEEIWIGPGEIVPAEGMIVAGRATLVPWPYAPHSVEVKIGERALAGAQIVDGALGLVAEVTGRDRDLFELVRPDLGRLDRALPAALWARRLSLIGAPLAGVVAWAVTRWFGAPLSVSLAAAAAAWGGGSGALLLHLPELTAFPHLAELARRGILFPSAALLDRAGQVSQVVFCARGTVLHGEPEVTEIEPQRGETPERVLALAAGAESVVHHPIARAVLRAAERRGVLPDPARSHQPSAGLGVVCVSSRGAELVVGSRELLLRERISVALAEEKLRRLESKGQSALLVAEDRHLLGVLALIDGLRAGARAAVQRLSAQGIEPVLLSGDSRETTDAVGRALAIEHLRPEVPAAERAREIERLTEGGAIVAVVGRSGLDEAALHAAAVPIALGGTSASLRERAVGTAGESPLDAALTLTVARALHQEIWRVFMLCWIPGAVTLLSVLLLVLPPVVTPLATTIGALLARFVILRRSSAPS